MVGGYSETDCGVFVECTSATPNGCTLQIGLYHNYQNFTETVMISANSSYNWNFSGASQNTYYFQLSSKDDRKRSYLRFNVSAGKIRIFIY